MDIIANDCFSLYIYNNPSAESPAERGERLGCWNLALTGPLGTESITLFSNTAASLISSSLAFSSSQVQDLKNHLTPVVPESIGQKFFQTQFSSTPSSFYDLLFQSSVIHDRGSFGPSKLPKAAAVSVSAHREQTPPLSRREIKVSYLLTIPPASGCRRAAPPGCGCLWPPEKELMQN